MRSILTRFGRTFIGDRAFYRSVFLLVLPLIVQQGLTSFVNLLDNVMVGRLGTESISGVAIVNQLIFVFNLTIFGGVSGASIYAAQFAGVRDHEGVRDCLRFKLLLGLLITAAALAVYVCFGDRLVELYLNDAGGAASLELTRTEALGYMQVALFGLPAFMVSQCFSSTLRETGETFAPMIAGLVALTVNLVLNYALIYGKLGAPAMGVRGAALATVIARFFETVFLLVYAYRRLERYPFLRGLLSSLRIPGTLVKRICVTGAPLLINELMWSAGQALINQSYSVRGLETIAAVNITATAWNLFAVLMFAMGSAVSILVGQKLGAGDMRAAREVDNKLLALDVFIHLGMGLLIIAVSGLIPRIYAVSDATRALTARMLTVAGLTLPLHALVHAIYFTIRSGGRTMLTLLFDSVFTWVVALPMAYLLCNHTPLPIVPIYACLQLADLVKLTIAFPMLLSGKWARNVIQGARSQTAD